MVPKSIYFKFQIYLYGGYSKEVSSDKSGSEKGNVHSDMWSLDPKTWEWNKVYILMFSPPLPCVHHLWWWNERSHVLSPLSPFIFPFKFVTIALYVADGIEPFDCIIIFDKNKRKYAKDALTSLD